VAKLLITGGAGFIGANFVLYWRGLHPNDSIVVLDALTYAGNRANLDAMQKDRQFEFVHGDICDPRLVQSLFRRHDFDFVVHFAAESHVDRSIVSSDAFVRTNVVGTHTLLDCALGAWKSSSAGRRFHHVSTDEVFGSLDPDDPPFTETSRYDPRSPYAASKAGSDFLVRSYAHTHGLPVTITNCSNNYGPYQFPEKLIPLMISNAIENRPLPIYGDGMQIRDWLYVDDHCRAILAALERGLPGQIYNIGGSRALPNVEVVRKILAALSKPESLMQTVRDRPGHDRRYALSSAKLMRESGWRPEVPFEEGLETTIDWYRSHPGWVARVKSGEYQQFYERNYQGRAV
jgi:dTDP-glucose 4,6-dehydratase